MSLSRIISPVVLKEYVKFWITEDIPNFDYSTLSVSIDTFVKAKIDLKEDCILAGIPFCDEIAKSFDCDFEWYYKEGEAVKKSSVVGILKGSAHKVLMVERTVLNILSRASGVATIARRVKSKISEKWLGDITGNRKTTPGFRIVEKYAMIVGGIGTHRYDLSELIIVKDNHLKVNGSSIAEAIGNIKKSISNKLIKIEVEVGSLKEAICAVKSGADIVMLDNFSHQDIKSVAKQIKDINRNVLIEASGGIVESNFSFFAVDNIDIISSSIFCQGYKCIDMSINLATDLASKNTVSNHVNLTTTNVSKEEVKPVEVKYAVEPTQSVAANRTLVMGNSSPAAVTNPPNNVSNKTPVDSKKPDLKRKVEESAVVAKSTPVAITTLKKVQVEPPAKKPPVQSETVSNTTPQRFQPNNKFKNKRASFEKPPNQGNNQKNNFDNNSRNNNTNNPNFSQNKSQVSYYGGRTSNMSYIGNPISTSAPGDIPRYGGNNRNNMLMIQDQPSYVRTMNSNKLFCRHCNIQNPINGPPYCQQCRSGLM